MVLDGVVFYCRIIDGVQINIEVFVCICLNCLSYIFLLHVDILTVCLYTKLYINSSMFYVVK